MEYEKFQQALKLLEEQNTRLQSLFSDQPEWILEAVRESAIQRFETCWDCLWKMLRRYLMEEVGLPQVPNGPKPVLRMAGENDLLPSSTEQWLQYARARIDTAHDYSGEKAQDALEIMGDFIDDAIDLYQTMSGESWE